MKSCSPIVGFVVVCLMFVLSRCIPQEVNLPGDVAGVVTDAETFEPLENVVVKVVPSNDSTLTENDGSFLLKNLHSGNYDIKASVKAYIKVTKPLKIKEAETTQVDFALYGTQSPVFSDSFLDFGYDKTLIPFSITNEGIGQFSYNISVGPKWISIYPETGNVSTESDTISVTIDRTGLPDHKIIEEINIVTYLDEGLKQYKIVVYVNGAPGQDGN